MDDNVLSQVYEVLVDTGVAAAEDWEALPAHLQDAIDRMLIDEVRTAGEETFDLEAVLSDSEP